jgi:hypothetical protein
LLHIDHHPPKKYTSTAKTEILRTVFNRSTEALNSLVDVLEQLPGQSSYAEPCAALSNATIGQHTRHVIELYQCLLSGYRAGEINYDDRKRNSVYENDIAAAVDAVKEIQLHLQQPDKSVKIFCEYEDNSVCIESNYYREVLYNLEHCIHHQALIKVALLSIKDILIVDSFGVAPSTLQYRQQCAQ